MGWEVQAGQSVCSNRHQTAASHAMTHKPAAARKTPHAQSPAAHTALAAADPAPTLKTPKPCHSPPLRVPLSEGCCYQPSHGVSNQDGPLAAVVVNRILYTCRQHIHLTRLLQACWGGALHGEGGRWGRGRQAGTQRCWCWVPPTAAAAIAATTPLAASAASSLHHHHHPSHLHTFTPTHSPHCTPHPPTQPSHPTPPHTTPHHPTLPLNPHPTLTPPTPVTPPPHPHLRYAAASHMGLQTGPCPQCSPSCAPGSQSGWRRRPGTGGSACQTCHQTQPEP